MVMWFYFVAKLLCYATYFNSNPNKVYSRKHINSITIYHRRILLKNHHRIFSVYKFVRSHCRATHYNHHSFIQSLGSSLVQLRTKKHSEWDKKEGMSISFNVMLRSTARCMMTMALVLLIFFVCVSSTHFW